MNNNNIDNIKAPVESELKEFNGRFKKQIKSDTELINLITHYILKRKGKQIRPILVFLSAKLSGEINDKTYRGATLVELLHTATLVHDDVVDDSEKRRGFPSINAIWKNKISVLMGDYLLSQGLMASVEGKDFDLLEIITNAVKRMSEGELLQISKTRKLSNNEETYFKIISDKTASLLSTCCQIGAKSVTENLEYINGLKNYGEFLGMAFQIRDDILDIVGTNVFGKNIGTDIKEKKLTLPVIYAIENSDKSKKNEIIKLIKKSKQNANLPKVIKIIKASGGIEYAEKVAGDFIQKAKNSLNIFSDESQTKQSLINLADFVIARAK